ncbi:unnamed protein product, partial [Meganyctiphanes norvegica]
MKEDIMYLCESKLKMEYLMMCFDPLRMRWRICQVWLMIRISMGRTTTHRFLLVENEDYNRTENEDANMCQSLEIFTGHIGGMGISHMSIGISLAKHCHDRNFIFGQSRRTVIGMQLRLWNLPMTKSLLLSVPSIRLHQVNTPSTLATAKGNAWIYPYNVKITNFYKIALFYFGRNVERCHYYAYTDNVIKYLWDNNTPIAIPSSLVIAQYDLVNYETQNYTTHFLTGDYSSINVTFFLRRQQGYHILQTYTPTILIVAISWVSFWLDPSHVAGRVTLGVTTLLTLTTIASGIRPTLAHVSYIKAIDVWIGVCMCMVFGALVEFTIVNWLSKRKKDAKSSFFSITKVVCKDTDSTVEPVKTYIPISRIIDRVCRIVFPGAFIIFNLFYWNYYMGHMKEHIGHTLYHS